VTSGEKQEEKRAKNAKREGETEKRGYTLRMSNVPSQTHVFSRLSNEKFGVMK